MKQSQRKTSKSLAVRAGVVLASTVAVTALAACSGGGAVKTSPAQPGGPASTARMKISMVTHGAQGDPFWDLVQKGAQAAAAKDDVELNYAGSDDPAQQATLVQQAIDSKVDGIAVTLAKPDQLLGSLTKAKDAGVPVVAFNAGLDDWQKSGALAFFGLDIKASGQVSGQQLAQAGGKHGICVIQEQGSVVLEALCDGVKQGFGSGSMDKVYVTGTDQSSVQATLTSKLQQDKSIDSIATLGVPIGMAALRAEDNARSTAKITTLNMSSDVVEPIKSGKILATIDQQGYLQGYEAVDALWLYKTNANIVGSGQPVLTGPTLVTKDNIDQIAPLIERGTR